jgi:hypothetical protein
MSEQQNTRQPEGKTAGTGKAETDAAAKKVKTASSGKETEVESITEVEMVPGNESATTGKTASDTGQAETDVTAEKVKTASSGKETEAESTTEAKTAPENESTTTGKTTAGDGMDYYRKCYPREREFHRTSDGQVFLSRDLSMAKKHQRSVDQAKEVTTIKA